MPFLHKTQSSRHGAVRPISSPLLSAWTRSRPLLVQALRSLVPGPIHPAHRGAPRRQGLRLTAFVFTPSSALVERPPWAGTVARGLPFSVTGGQCSGARGQEREQGGWSFLVKWQGSEGSLPGEQVPQSGSSLLVRCTLHVGTMCPGPLRCLPRTHSTVEAQSWDLWPASGCGFPDIHR